MILYEKIIQQTPASAPYYCPKALAAFKAILKFAMNLATSPCDENGPSSSMFSFI